MDDTKKRSSIPAKNGRCAPELYNELVDLESDNWATYLTAAKTLQITENELWVLLEVFDADPPLCQADIARRIHIPVQTLNSALSKMNRKGWIDFVPIPGSQKAKGVKLTQAGQKKFHPVLAGIHQAETNAFASLDPEQARAMLDSIHAYTLTFQSEMKRLLDTIKSDSDE